MPPTVRVRSAGGKFSQSVLIRQHEVISDELPEIGGDDRGPSPTELLLASVGACVAMTLEMYAARKGWELGDLQLELTAHDEQGVYVIERRITYGAPLTDEQRQRLGEIAGRCPVSRRITGPVEIRAVD